MKEKRKWRRPQAVDVLFFLGAALVSVGVALWACPGAGMVTAGGFCLATSWLAERAGKDGEDA